MIQRIQSLYLLIAIICSIVAIAFLYVSLPEHDKAHYTYMLVMFIGAFVDAVALVKFTQRKQQLKYILRASILNMMAICISAFWVACDTCVIENKVLLILLPTLSLLFGHLAFRGIRADELKVKAADRIR